MEHSASSVKNTTPAGYLSQTERITYLSEQSGNSVQLALIFRISTFYSHMAFMQLLQFSE
jgi:hypothetical protein